MLPINTQVKSTQDNQLLPSTVQIDLDEESHTWIDIDDVKDSSYEDEPYSSKERTRLPRKFDKQNKRKKNKLVKQARRKNRS